MSYKLEVANASHIQEIHQLTLKAFSEGPTGLVVNEEKMLRYVQALVLDAHSLALVASQDHKVLGVVLGEVSGHAYCDGLIAEDVCIYVDKALRGTSACKELITAYTDWCGRIPNLLGSTLGISQLGPTTQYLDSVYRSLGYRRVGVTYIKQGDSE